MIDHPSEPTETLPGAADEGEGVMAEPVASDEAAEPAAAAAPEPAVAERPEGIPDKFWDPEAGALRTDSLLKSYLELERKLGTMIAPPADAEEALGNKRLRQLLGVPESAEDYQIEARDAALHPDPAINARLHEAGFTQRQAQLVYDLAAEHVLPAIESTLAEVEAGREAERLAARFGGEQVWRPLAQQLRTWGRANLPEDVFAVLSSSYDGVIAMHQMMQAREPAVLREADGPAGQPREAELQAMMRDPRYWRQRDPAFVAEVTEGFKRLYAG
jgi:hypothetical protein